MVRQDDEEMEVEAGAHRLHLVTQLQILTLSLQKIVLYAMKRYDDILFDLCFRTFELFISYEIALFSIIHVSFEM